MSDEFRKSILKRLPAMEATRAPWAQVQDDSAADEELEDGDGLGELDTSTMHTPGDFGPVSAAAYFDQALEVVPEGSNARFRTYLSPPSGKGRGHVVVMHHGAGAGALSFAPLAGEVRQRSGGELGTLAYDCRGHGKTTTTGSDTDLSLPTLLDDLVGVIGHVYPDPKTAPSLVLVGHSMGAAPVLSAAPVLQNRGYTVSGVAVLDVVEGTAVEALPLMKTILSKRPNSFHSVVEAIRWHNTIRDAMSARVSVPSLLSATGSGPEGTQVWRTDLLATEPYWAEWYNGLSERFLSSRCARLLVLAGQERLDKALMGKFQLEVMQDVGHYLHEDDPAALAAILVGFWRRNTQPIVLPPKIGSTGPNKLDIKRVGDA